MNDLEFLSEDSHRNNQCDVLLVGYENQENLGLRSIAAYLMKNGIRVRIEPCQNMSKEEMLTHIRAEDPKIVGFSLIFQRMLPGFADLIYYLRENGVTAHFTIGGHFPTIQYRELLALIPGLDSVVRHEGEYTLLELYQSLDQHDALQKIKGIAYRKDGEIVCNSARPLIKNLDSLPFPVRNQRASFHRDLGICSIAGSRGCYYDCSFCSIQEFYREPEGPKRRYRSPMYVAKEMEMLFHELGIRIFIFQDDDLFMKGRHHRKWIEDFIRELEEREIADKIIWRVSCRIDDLSKEMLLIMKAAGLISVYLGIESGSDQGLVTFNKHYKVKDVYKTLKMLNEIKMPYEYGFMIFEPESTCGTIRENIEFLRRVSENGDALVNFCKMVPYAGTPITRKLVVENRLEGPAHAPDYRYRDPRLDLLQLYFSQTFNYRNFSEKGLVEKLRFAKFDCMVLDKYYSGQYDVQKYACTLKELIHQCNQTALENMSLAESFMEKHNEKEIIAYWPLLEGWQQDEFISERMIDSALDQLLSEYDLQTSALEFGFALS